MTQQGTTTKFEDLSPEEQQKFMEWMKKGQPEAGTVEYKVSEKGAISIYGIRRFPITLYKDEMLKILDDADNIREFITKENGRLKSKP